MPVFCIVFLQLSLLNFFLCLVARFRALSNSSLRTNNVCMYISIFFLFIVCFFRLKVCGLLPLPSSKVWGERCLSHVIVHSHPHTHCSHCCKQVNHHRHVHLSKTFLIFLFNPKIIYTIIFLYHRSTKKPQFIISCSSLPLFIINTNCCCFSTDLYSEILFHLSVSKPFSICCL